MKLNVSAKIVYSELVIIAVIYMTCIPYILVSMDFKPMQLFHYINVTMIILSPLGIASAFYFIDRWECRPIEMLTFYLERRLDPPDDIMAAARVRTLNLPLVHAITVLIRYEIVTLFDCLYMGTVGGLPLKENIRLGIYAAVGLSIFPIFSFFLTERFLYPVRQSWLNDLGVTRQRFFLLDTKPVPVVGVKRSNRHSDFAGSAGYGRCASRSLTYFGYKLVALTTLGGLPVTYDLVSARTSEWKAAEVVLEDIHGCHIIADKGFVSEPWQEFIYEQTGNRIWTTKRKNQHVQNPPALDRFLKSARERIEGVFHELTDTGRNLEKLLAKTVSGLSTRIIAKVTSHALRHLLLLKFGVKVLTFEMAASCS